MSSPKWLIVCSEWSAYQTGSVAREFKDASTKTVAYVTMGSLETGLNLIHSYQEVFKARAYSRGKGMVFEHTLLSFQQFPDGVAFDTITNLNVQRLGPADIIRAKEDFPANE